MAIIIKNVDAILRKEGRHIYQLRSNTEVICEFVHNREEGLAQCLRKAADAVDEAREEKK